MLKLQVSTGEAGQRLQAFLLKHIDQKISARELKRALEQNRCLLNGKIERFSSRRVQRGDQVGLDLQGWEKTQAPPEPKILYEDEQILVVNKPAGMLSTEGGVLSVYRKKFPGLRAVHRLDRDTTGVLVFARGREAQRALEDLFKKRMVKKTYLALSHGIPKKKIGEIRNFLGPVRTYQGQTVWGKTTRERGKEAITRYSIEKKGCGASLLKVKPLTGRTHQIRTHLKELGCPIVGDVQYSGKGQGGLIASRQLLHCMEIGFPHPFTGEWLQIKAKVPTDIRDQIKKLFYNKKCSWS